MERKQSLSVVNHYAERQLNVIIIAACIGIQYTLYMVFNCICSGWKTWWMRAQCFTIESAMVMHMYGKCRYKGGYSYTIYPNRISKYTHVMFFDFFYYYFPASFSFYFSIKTVNDFGYAAYIDFSIRNFRVRVLVLNRFGFVLYVWVKNRIFTVVLNWKSFHRTFSVITHTERIQFSRSFLLNQISSVSTPKKFLASRRAIQSFESIETRQKNIIYSDDELKFVKSFVFFLWSKNRMKCKN